MAKRNINELNIDAKTLGGVNASLFPYFRSLSNTEEYGSSITLLDFFNKYVKDLPIGSLISHNAWYSARIWYVIIDGENRSMQDHVCIVMKKNISADGTWNRIDILFVPLDKKQPCFIASLRTRGSADDWEELCYYLTDKTLNTTNMQTLDLQANMGGV